MIENKDGTIDARALKPMPFDRLVQLRPQFKEKRGSEHKLFFLSTPGAAVVGPPDALVVRWKLEKQTDFEKDFMKDVEFRQMPPEAYPWILMKSQEAADKVLMICLLEWAVDSYEVMDGPFEGARDGQD